MKFKLIDKSSYEDVAPKSYELTLSHTEKRPDLFGEPALMTKKAFKNRIKVKGFVGIAAYENDALVGYCFCRINSFRSKESPESKRLWIDEFFICEEYRRQGYGTELSEEIKRTAKAHGCFVVEFNVWQMNETAQKFYDSLGCKNQRIIKEITL